jgi:dTDP-4-dehydrorhamnose reductase
MARRVVVVGGMGMLGRAMLSRLSELSGVEVVGTYHAASPSNPEALVSFDVTSCDDALENLLRGADVVVNCAGSLASAMQGVSQERLLKSFQVNSVFPKRLALVAAQCGARVVHISSDAVFSGRQGAPYSEDSVPDPADAYGISKLLGEVNAANVVNLRTSIVGFDKTYHRGLLEWVLSQPAGAVINGYHNHIWQGVTVRQLSEMVASLVESRTFDDSRQEGAVHHFCPNEALSKYELLELIAQEADLNLTVRRMDAPEGAVDRRLVTKHTVLSSRYNGCRGMKEAVRDLLEK